MSKLLAMSFVFAGTSVAAPAIWDGTADDSWYEPSAQAYNLVTAEQLAGLAKLVNEGTSNFTGKTITLGTDIFLNDTTGAGAGTWENGDRRLWTPIGTSSHPFKGEFDGIAGKKNRKIYGLYFNDSTASYAGLFGYTDGVRISNVDLLVGSMTAKDSSGALVGYALNGAVTNVHSNIPVSGRNYVGGLSGYTSGNMSESSVQGNVTGQNFVGGLAGSGQNVSRSYAKGVVQGTSDYVGGIIGYSGGSLDSVYHIGGNVSGRKYVGGIAGFIYYITASYAEGSVQGTSDYVGGIAGRATSVNNSYHTDGDVKGQDYVGGVAGSVMSTYGVTLSYSKGNVTGQNYVGGLIGEGGSNARISQSYAEGIVTGSNYVGGLAGNSNSIAGTEEQKSYFIGSVTGYKFVGGLVGSGNSISQSYAEAPIIGKSDFVGGLAGRLQMSIKDSYHKGNVTTKGNFVGGLIGLSLRSTNTTGLSSNDSTYVYNSYAIGNVNGAKYVGGLIGKDSIYKKLSSSQNGSSPKIVRTLANSYSKGSVEGLSHIGGLIGVQIAGTDSSNRYATTKYIRFYVKSCHHEDGDITGDSNFVSGGIGLSNSVRIDSVYHIGGNINGLSYVGGVAGSTIGPISNSYAKASVKGGSDYVGGVVGLASDSVLNSYAEGTMMGQSYVGGVAGKAGAMKDCYHVGGNIAGTSYVGGLAGYTKDVFSSYSESDVVATGSYAGGLSGYTGGSISTSHSKGNVSGTRNVGGLSGQATSFVTKSYSEGDVTATENNEVGGLLGRAGSNVSQSYSKGNVTGHNYVGGLVGIGNKISESHAEGIVTGTSNYVGGLAGRAASISGTKSEECYFIGSVKGNQYVGGLVGSGTAISQSYATSSVTGKTNFVGGLAGFVDSSITDSYHEGDVTTQGNFVGGLVGLSRRYIGTTGNAKKDSTFILNSHAIGNVKGRNNVGGLVGLDSIYKILSSNKSNSNSPQIVRALINSYSKGTVEGNAYVGGLIGKQSVGSDSSNKFATNTYMTFFTRLSSHQDGDVSGDSIYVSGGIGYSQSHRIDSTYHSNGDIDGLAYVGGIAGYTTGSITNSHSKGAVSGDSAYVGGIVGYSLDSISNSYANGAVKGNADYVGGIAGRAAKMNVCNHLDGNVEGLSHVGGIAGYSASIKASSHSGGNISGLDYVGGAVGETSNYLEIVNTNATAAFVKGRNSVGGLVGYIKGNIRASYFEGDSVTGIYQVGGLAGYASGTVDSSYSTANIKGDDNVGGLIGSAYGNVSHSYASGNIIGDVDNSSAGNDNLGGLVGYQYSGAISYSAAIGNVTGTTKIGGLVGRFEGTKISQSYANGNVTGCFDGDPADEVGNYYIGGLVGFAKGSLDETYSSGIVKGIEDGPVYTGCMVGYVNGSLSVTKSYYDKTKCNLGIDGGENAVTLTGTPGKTTEEMQIQSTFENWNFTNVWKMMEGTYPFLQIYANSLINAVVLTESLEGFEYDGFPKAPQVTTVTLYGDALTENVDYAVKYERNVNAGTAKISVCGLNLYSGCKVIEFEIAPKAILPIISAIEDVVYTGWAMVPEISVYNGEALLDASNYTVEYSDNVNAGTASVVITMKENYSGSAIKTFTIGKANPVITQNPGASDITVGSTLALSDLANGTANVPGSFAWKNPEIIPALENEGYVVVFTPNDGVNYNSVEMSVPVKVWDVAYVAVHVGERTLDSVVVVKGTDYTLPIIPDSVGYVFAGFFQGDSAIGFSGDVVSVSENTVIDAKYSIKIFAVNFMNGETELQLDSLPYGSLPEYIGSTPIKVASAKYTYTFKGWNPAIETVSKSATYTAVFDSVVNKYVITFMDGNTELQSSEVEYGTMPTPPTVTLPENTAQYTYSFGGWDKEVVSVTGAATYSAVIDRTVNKYRVVFKDFDGTTLKDVEKYDYGTSASDIAKPSNPIRENTAQYTYAFKGWNPVVSDVTEDMDYVAEYDSTLQNYTITFVNDSEMLQSTNVDYGVMPTYDGATPVKVATAKYTYVFRGWNPAIETVSKSATYTAVFDSVVNKYVITFMDGNTELQSSEVEYGTMPTPPTVTLPENTAQYTYSFGGWDKEVVSVTGAATYSAVIDRTVNKYRVVFKDFDGTTLKDVEKYDYGTSASDIAKPSNPIRENTAQYTYAFKGWNPVVSDVTEDMDYVAEYDSTLQNYTITFVNDSETLQSSEFVYGAIPSYKGSVPTKKETRKCAYTFKGWSPAITAVTGAATYKAVFDSTIQKYVVVFKNGDALLQTITVAYGEIPKYTGDTPTKETTNDYSYEFVGWSPKVEPIAKETEFYAVFDSTKVTGMQNIRLASSKMSVNALSRTIQISAAPVGKAYALIDLQGHILQKGIVELANFNIAVPRAGSYFIRMDSQIRKVNVF